MKRLALLGASGHGKVVAELAEKQGYDEIVFFDDRWPNITELKYWDVIGDSRSLIKTGRDFYDCLVTIGDNRARSSKHALLIKNGLSLTTLVHPSANVSDYSSIGQGSVIMSGAVIQTDVSIGCSCIVNSSANVDHDVVIGDFCHVSPNAAIAGNVIIGSYSWVGIGSVVRESLSVGCNTIIGAGAAVVDDVGSDSVVVGVPARSK